MRGKVYLGFLALFLVFAGAVILTGREAEETLDGVRENWKEKLEKLER